MFLVLKCVTILECEKELLLDDLAMKLDTFDDWYWCGMIMYDLDGLGLAIRYNNINEEANSKHWF